MKSMLNRCWVQGPGASCKTGIQGVGGLLGCLLICVNCGSIRLMIALTATHFRMVSRQKEWVNGGDKPTISFYDR